MKRWALFALGLFIFTTSHAQAAEWQPDEVITGYLRPNVTGTHSITLEKDATVTFTLKDGTGDYDVILSDDTNGRFAAISTIRDDGDEEKTVQSFNLKKGTYTVTVAGHYFNYIGNYEVSYETSPIIGTDVEPNNVQPAANVYGLGDTYHGELYGVGVVNDHDTYKVEVPEFGKLKVQFQPTEGNQNGKTNIHIEGVNEQSTKMFKLTSYNKPSELEVLLQPGTHYFKVYMDGTIRPIVKYSFSTSFEPLDEQSWESGRNITFQSADVLENNKTYNGFLYGSTSNYFQDNDYYKLILNKDTKVTFIANAYKDLGAFLFFDKNGQLDNGGSATGTTSKLVAAKELPAGTYYVVYRPRYIAYGYEGYDFTMRIERFKDVPAMYPYYSQIEELAQLGIHKGYPDGTFHPNESIKRMHVFTLLNRIAGLNLTKIREMKAFRDVTASHPYYSDIKAFYEAGIVDGNGINMNPESNLTRAQLAKILVQTFDLKMKGSRMDFTDVSPANGFYSYIQILASNGITTGTNGKFMPNSPVTRQHFSVFLQRTLNVTHP